MLNEIIKGISIKLNAAFGDGYEIYDKDVEQGLTEPCFFIDVLKPEISPLLGTRGIRRNPFDIHYFPKDSRYNGEMYAIAERLMYELAFITVPSGEQLRGTKMAYEIVEGVLHFFVNYNLTVIQPPEWIPMETLTTDVGTKKG